MKTTAKDMIPNTAKDILRPHDAYHQRARNPREQVSVPADERLPFFHAIKEAQVGGRTDRFISFLWRHIRHANADIAKVARVQRRGRHHGGGGVVPTRSKRA